MAWMILDRHTTPQKRLDAWRDFRKIHASSSPETIVECFNLVKYDSNNFDYYTHKSWPDCWDILTNKMFCYSGVNLLLFDTLTALDKVCYNNATWHIVDNHITGQAGLVFMIDNQCFNITPGKIDNYNNIKEDFLIFNTIGKNSDIQRIVK